MSLGQSKSAIRAKLSMSMAWGASRLTNRKTLWIWPIVAVTLLIVIGWTVGTMIERSVKSTMADNLQTILDADVTAMKIWLKVKQSNAQAAARDKAVRQHVEELLQIATSKKDVASQLQQSSALSELRAELRHDLEAHNYSGFVIIDSKGLALAAQRDDPVGKDNLPIPEGLLQKLFVEKRTIVTPPFPSAILLEDEKGQLRAGLPTMFVVAPVIDDQQKVVAALGLRIRPEDDFSRILSVAQSGQSGETYAFNARGTLLSQSRFDDQLKVMGLITDKEDVKSLLNLEIRDPRVDMTQGVRPQVRRSEQPLTRMAASAIEGESAVDVEGYSDYRGVKVIGAWTWLPEYNFGIATEVDAAEAFRPLYLLRWTFWGLFGLIALASIAIFVFSVLVAQANREARHAALEAKQLGQYSLDEKIGEGGMGVVYRGHHTMLRRPTAIKLLSVEKTTEDAIARFEREVQLTSQLNHPNTIAVYDYGRTPEGIFYYAMEFLGGIDLDQLVQDHGPQPEGRVIHILQQLCGSLAEAHSVGLIHRDIKPANVFLTQLGGIYDFVKLLDFGLVKAVDARREVTLTMAGAMTGTPAYMSPEAVEHPDQVDIPSDLYAVGAVGYYLLAGRPVFEGQSVVEVCMKQVNAPPPPIEPRLGKPVSKKLEAVLMACLAKDPQQRPHTAEELGDVLAALAKEHPWSSREARQWWEEREREKDQALRSTEPNINETIALNRGPSSLEETN